MSFDISKVVSQLGDDLIAKTGEPVGLSRDQSLAVARSLAAHFSKGGDEAVKAAAAETGVAEEAVGSMCAKLVEVGKEKLLTEGPVGQAVDTAKEQAMAALNDAGGQAMKSAGGFLGKLFGKK